MMLKTISPGCGVRASRASFGMSHHDACIIEPDECVANVVCVCMLFRHVTDAQYTTDYVSATSVQHSTTTATATITTTAAAATTAADIPAACTHLPTAVLLPATVSLTEHSASKWASRFHGRSEVRQL